MRFAFGECQRSTSQNKLLVQRHFVAWIPRRGGDTRRIIFDCCTQVDSRAKDAVEIYTFSAFIASRLPVDQLSIYHPSLLPDQHLVGTRLSEHEQMAGSSNSDVLLYFLGE